MKIKKLTKSHSPITPSKRMKLQAIALTLSLVALSISVSGCRQLDDKSEVAKDTTEQNKSGIQYEYPVSPRDTRDGNYGKILGDKLTFNAK